MRYDLCTLDLGERSLPFGPLVLSSYQMFPRQLVLLLMNIMCILNIFFIDIVLGYCIMRTIC